MTPRPVPLHAPTPASLLDECLRVYRRWLYLPDPGALYVSLGAVAANLLDGDDPVWLLLVGPPSSGKTEILGGFAQLPYVHPAATLTEPALLSGVPKKEHTNGAKGGLLRQIGDFGIILCKDFTSVLAQNRDTRAAVLAAMREVYDGSWTRHVGTEGGRTLHWTGKVGLIAGCTPAIDLHHAVVGAMGERMVLFRLTPDDPARFAAGALEHAGREREMRAELVAAVTSVIAAAEPAARPLGADEVTRLIRLATFAVRARSAVERDGYRQEVLMIPEPEAPARFVLVLRRLLHGLEAVGVDPDDVWPLLARVSLDCMPATRQRLLSHLMGLAAPTRTATIAGACSLPTRTAHRHLEDLALLGVADRGKEGEHTTASDLWSATAWTREHYPPSPEIPDALIYSNITLERISGKGPGEPASYDPRLDGCTDDLETEL